MLKLVFRAAALTVGMSLSFPAAQAHAGTAGIRVPDTEAQIMPLDDVRVGMRGYGKSVFAGTAIETFPVVVRSVVSDSSAGRGTVWIECTGERMRHSGPVQGMSGSPIYLWDDPDPEAVTRTDGVGGRLVGAFAFGYADVNVCLVGVQPIAYMREVGENAVASEAARLDAAGGRSQEQARRGRGVTPGTLTRGLSQMNRLAQDEAVPAAETVALRAITQVLGQPAGLAVPATPPPTDDSAPRALALPVSVGSAEAARWLAPALQPSGLAVRASQGWGPGATPHNSGPLIGGTPPSNVDLAEANLEPGSVLSIPLAWGDMDLNASGTVTEVRPDGTVLAFGHAMNAVGDTRLPIATGYTHFVVSRRSISFKRASSLGLVGTLLRDEQAAVAGRPLRPADDTNPAAPDAAAFDAAPVAVRVEMPGQPARDYNFMVVDEPAMTAGLVAAVVINAVNAVQEFPDEHTLRLTGTLAFSGDRTLSIDTDIPNGGARGIVFTLLPYIFAMMQNQFEPLSLEHADLSVVIDQGINQLVIESATLDRATARPGETVSIAVRLQPYRQPAITQTVALPLPADLPEGEYEVMVTDVGGYVARLFLSRPDLAQVSDIDGVHQMTSALVEADGNTIYAALSRNDFALAVSNQALPGLPGSRTAVLNGAATTRVSEVPRFIEASAVMDQPVGGVLVVPLVVQDKP